MGRIVEMWSVAAAKSSYVRGAEFNLSEEVRVDRMKAFLGAVIHHAENLSDKQSHQVLKAAIRAEHAGMVNFGAVVKKQNLLRDSMLRVLESELPGLSKTTMKLALDAMVDRAIEGTVLLMEQYAELRSSLAECMPGAPDSKFSFDQSLARFCGNLREYFEVDFAGVFRFDTETRELACVACSAKGMTLQKDASIRVEVFPVVQEALATRKVTVSAGQKQAHKKGGVAHRFQFGTTVAVPLFSGEENVGVLLLGDSSRLVPVTPSELSMVEDIGVQVVWVLKSTAMFQQLNVRSRAQKVLVDTAATLQREIESEEIYRIILSRLIELIPCSESAFYLFDWQKGTCSPVFATGPYVAEIMADRDFPATIGIVGYVGKTRRGEIVMDTEADPRGEYIPGTSRVKSRMLAVPVVGRKETLGVLELTRYLPETFTQEDLEIGQLFANHAAVAIENAALVKELTKARDQIEMHMDLLTHDIANYATPILAYFEFLRSRPNLDSQVATALEKVSRQAEHMMRLIDMVRVLSRLREGPPRNLRSMDLRKAIDTALVEVLEKSRMSMLEVELVLPKEDVMMVRADDLLGDIFVNLFYSAALTEKREKTKLTVAADPRKDKKGEYWWIKVSQPSRVIPSNMKGEVLRMSKGTKSELVGGFGMGLAAAKAIVDRYEGNMWVSDIVQGDYTKGCVFNIVLPRVQ